VIEILADPDEFGAEAEPLLASTVRNIVPATVPTRWAPAASLTRGEHALGA
jgi:hypothetical protein